MYIYMFIISMGCLNNHPNIEEIFGAKIIIKHEVFNLFNIISLLKIIIHQSIIKLQVKVTYIIYNTVV